MANGPVQGVLNADQLQYYTSGIFGPSDCSTTVNHGIAIVGWGIQNGVKYWIIKNSWGTDSAANRPVLGWTIQFSKHLSSFGNFRKLDTF